MGAGSDEASSDDHLARALSLVTDILRSKGRETGANIGHILRREIPGFDPHKLGYTSLSRLLFEAADDLVVVDRKGDDRVWALGEFVSDRDIEHALGPEAETETETGDGLAFKTSALPTRIDLVNFRSCRDVRLELALAGLTVLVGPNGSGKSTILH